jgi:hypothetical protein
VTGNCGTPGRTEHAYPEMYSDVQYEHPKNQVALLPTSTQV